VGDMADWFLERALDGDCGNGYEYDQDEDGLFHGPSRGPQPKRCKFCHEYPLYWYEPWPHHWRLRRADGAPHKCDRTPATGKLLQSLKRRFM
jgi:hypothetical protein